jgi:hypothetical protein
MAYDPLRALLSIDTKKKDETSATGAGAASSSAAQTFAAILKDAKAGTLPPLSAKKPEDTNGVYKVDLASSGFTIVKVVQPDGTNAMLLENVATGRVTNLKGFTSVSFSDEKSVDLASFASKAPGDVRGFNGGATADKIEGRADLVDALFGNDGDDAFSVLSNRDVVDGGLGQDTISLTLAPNAYRVMQQMDANKQTTYTISWVEAGTNGVQQSQSISVTNVESVTFPTGGGQDGKSSLTLSMQDFAYRAGYSGY